jgi:hypothetical protein
MHTLRLSVGGVDGGTRALRTWLQKQTSIQIEVSEKEIPTITEERLMDKLPPPDMPDNMQLTRGDMLRYLRRNFELGKQHIASAPSEEKESIAEASAARCAPLESWTGVLRLNF